VIIVWQVARRLRTSPLARSTGGSHLDGYSSASREIPRSVDGAHPPLSAGTPSGSADDETPRFGPHAGQGFAPAPKRRGLRMKNRSIRWNRSVSPWRATAGCGEDANCLVVSATSGPWATERPRTNDYARLPETNDYCRALLGLVMGPRDGRVYKESGFWLREKPKTRRARRLRHAQRTSRTSGGAGGWISLPRGQDELRRLDVAGVRSERGAWEHEPASSLVAKRVVH